MTDFPVGRPLPTDPTLFIGRRRVDPWRPLEGPSFHHGAPLDGARHSSRYGVRRTTFATAGAPLAPWHAANDWAAPLETRIEVPEVWIDDEGEWIEAETRVIWQEARRHKGAAKTIAGITFREGDLSGLGNFVVLEHARPGEAFAKAQVRSGHAHMVALPEDSLGVVTGDVLRPGDACGLVGSTGLSTGPHDHETLGIGPAPGAPPALAKWSGHLRDVTLYMSERPFVPITLADMGNVLQRIFFENDPETTYALEGDAHIVGNNPVLVEGRDWRELRIQHRGVLAQGG